MISKSSLLDLRYPDKREEELKVSSMTSYDGQIIKTIYAKIEERAISEEVKYHTLGSTDLLLHLLDVQRYSRFQTSKNLKFPNKDRAYSY